MDVGCGVVYIHVKVDVRFVQGKMKGHLCLLHGCGVVHVHVEVDVKFVQGKVMKHLCF